VPAADSDAVRIRGLKLQARVGVTESERAQPQPIQMDLTLFLPLTKAGRSDDMTETVDYAAVCRETAGIVAAQPFNLVEAIAEQTADRLLWKFRPRRVRVTVRKFSVPEAESVGVTISRGR